MRDHRLAVENDEFADDSVGGNSVEMKIRRRVQNRIQAQYAFYVHLIVFLIVNVMLWLIWLASRGGFPWPIFVTLPWSVGLAAQAWLVYQYLPEPAARHEEEIQREVEREKRRMGVSTENLQRD